MKTGFEELDNIIGSLNNGELTCIASRPGIGKTTLAIDIVNNVTNKSEHYVDYKTRLLANSLTFIALFIITIIFLQGAFSKTTNQIGRAHV